MVQVVRWYLSSYHAGRKSTVAKKPYNPILGEVFRCHWDVPNSNNGSDDSTVDDGPVPWCKRSQLTFVAEQVSHHPPSKYIQNWSKLAEHQMSVFIWQITKNCSDESILFFLCAFFYIVIFLPNINIMLRKFWTQVFKKLLQSKKYQLEE